MNSDPSLRSSRENGVGESSSRAKIQLLQGGLPEELSFVRPFSMPAPVGSLPHFSPGKKRLGRATEGEGRVEVYVDITVVNVYMASTTSPPGSELSPC